MRYKWAACAISATILSIAHGAVATPTRATAAEALFDQARALVTQRRFEEACEKFAESERLDPASGPLTNLAHCYEVTGRLASAWTSYRELVALAERERQTGRAANARKKAAELELKLARITLRLAADAAGTGIEVVSDGMLISEAALGTSIPVDPGEHRIEVRAPGKRMWTHVFTVDSQPTLVDIVIPRLADDFAATMSESETTVPPQPTSVHFRAPTSANPNPAAEPSNGQKVSSLAIGTLGIVSIGAGAYFGVRAIGLSSTAKSECGALAPHCADSNALATQDDAARSATISTVLVAAGAVAVAGGALLYLTAPHDEHRSARLAAGALMDISNTPTGVRVSGEW